MKHISVLKHNLMRATLTLALIVTCATAWAQNPNLAEYEFTTGQDASKWITLSGNAIQMIASGQDDANSDLTSIGFDFPFGDGTYSQFWTSSNGILSFNSTPESNWRWQFTSNGSQANQPKICGISADMSTGDNGYVKYEVTGTTPNRVLVCEFFLYGGGSGIDFDANIKWQVQLHEANANVVMVYGDYLYTNLNSNQIGLSQSGSDIWTINVLTHEATHSTEPVESNNPVNIWPGANRYYEFNPPAPEDFTDNGDGTYTINTAAGWGLFCDAIEGGESFNGKTVYLGADITITRMANNADPCFRGTFDGQGHTLTLDYGTATNPVDAQFVAPFVMTYWNTSPTFRNLTIDGHIYSTCTANVDGKNTGGLIGHLYGDVTIEHCTSNVEIINSSGGAGGFVGLCEHTVNFNDCMSSNVIHSAGGNNSGFVSWSRASGYEINFTGCVFNGKLLQINGEGHSNGGFIGWTGSNKTVSITNCLYAPAALAEGEAYASYNSATFARGWNATTTATNSYYTTDFNDGTHYTGQGTQAYSISADQNVTVENAGTATTYATSGITSYGTGIKYNNVLYAGNGDAVSLTLNHSEAPTGYTFTGYTANAGTLNGTTLTMPNENVIISATMTPNSYTVHFDGNGNTGGSMSDQTFTYGVAQNLTANAFTRTGFAFTEWNTQANGGGTSYTNGQEVINLTDQGTVTLYAQWESIAVSYLDEDGVEQQCINYTLLTGNETYLAAGWYVADGNVTFSNTINVAYGNVHIILKDNAVMNVGTEQSPISEHGIYVYNNKSLNIYAQSTGADKGRLNVYATKRGIEMNAASLTINGGEVTANGNNKYGIYAYSYSNITINGGQVTATGSSGIYTNVNGSVNINGGQVTATGNNYGINASQNSTLTISGGQVTATGNGNNSDGILSTNGTLTISGGQVTANGNGDYSYGITTYYRAITLGWTNPTDFIYANSYHVYESTINIAEGKTFITDDGNTYTSGALTSEQLEAIAGKKLYPYVEGSVPYIDENGQRQLRLAGEYTILTGDENSLGTPDEETWYVAQGTLDYSSTITLSGDTHIILADDAVMNVTVSGSNNHGIKNTSGNNYSLFVYGQSGQSGELNVTSSDNAILNYGGDITIAGGKVTASGANGIMADGGNVTIKNATVTATTTSDGRVGAIRSNHGDITIDNSNVTATGTGNSGGAIFADNGDIIIRNGGKTTANENNNVAIYALEGNLTITGCEVEATGAKGIHANNSDNNGDDGNVTIQNATVTATSTGSYVAILSYNGDITIDNSNVTATSTGSYGIYAQNSGNILLNGGKITANGSRFGLICDAGNVTIEGGQVESIGGDYGILAGNITLGWTNATDYIYVSRYMDYEGDPITLTKTFIDEAGNTYSGTIEQVSGAYSINGKTLRPIIAPTTVTQTITLSEGWNWVSLYITADGPVALLDMLKEGLGDNALQIQASNGGVTEFDGEDWFGDLDDEGIFNEQAYWIEASADCTFELTGMPAVVDEYEITINPGWNWIGFPSAEPIDIADALADFEAEEADQIQCNDATSTEFDGEEWFGDLETFTPGQGYMYFSASDEVKTLVFSTGAKWK